MKFRVAAAIFLSNIISADIIRFYKDETTINDAITQIKNSLSSIDQIFFDNVNISFMVDLLENISEDLKQPLKLKINFSNETNGAINLTRIINNDKITAFDINFHNENDNTFKIYLILILRSKKNLESLTIKNMKIDTFLVNQLSRLLKERRDSLKDISLSYFITDSIQKIVDNIKNNKKLQRLEINSNNFDLKNKYLFDILESCNTIIESSINYYSSNLLDPRTLEEKISYELDSISGLAEFKFFKTNLNFNDCLDILKILKSKRNLKIKKIIITRSTSRFFAKEYPNSSDQAHFCEIFDHFYVNKILFECPFLSSEQKSKMDDMKDICDPDKKSDENPSLSIIYEENE